MQNEKATGGERTNGSGKQGRQIGYSTRAPTKAPMAAATIPTGPATSELAALAFWALFCEVEFPEVAADLLPVAVVDAAAVFEGALDEEMVELLPVAGRGPPSLARTVDSVTEPTLS